MKLYIDSNKRKIKYVIVNGNKVEYYNEIDIKNAEKANVYMGEVVSINSQINGVFIDYGGSKPGFLSYYSIHPFYFQISSKERLLKNLQLEQKPLKDSIFYKQYNIKDVVYLGQRMIVQVIREKTESKGAMLSTFISLGDSFSYLPNAINNSFIFGDVRKEIKEGILNIFRKWNASGLFILKKFSFVDEDAFFKKLDYIVGFWQSMTPAVYKSKIGLICANDNAIIDDYYLEKVTKIFYCGSLDIIKFLKDKNINIPSEYKESPLNIWQNQINTMWSQKLPLSCGGYIFFTYCEGGTFIDVNIGSNKYNSFLEINLEASNIICEQIKLRNISGIIFVDFIDMNEGWLELEKNILQKLEGKAKIKVVTVSNFGNLIIYRQNAGGFSCAEYFEKKQRWTLSKVANNMLEIIDNKFGTVEMSNDLFQFCKNTVVLSSSIIVKIIKGEKYWRFTPLN